MQGHFHNGIFVLLQPQFNLQSEMVSFTVKLYNSTEYPVHFESYFYAYFQGEHKLEESVYPDEIVIINGFQFSEFNNNPTLEIKLTIEHDDDESIEIIKTLKFKAKTITTEPIWLNQEHPKVFAFELFRFKEAIDEHETEGQKTEKPEFDTQLLKEMMLGGSNNKTGKIIHEDAPHEIDLHIEAINPAFNNKPAAEILAIQMSRFQQVLERAIASGHHSLMALVPAF
jgi:hypothetical protein